MRFLFAFNKKIPNLFMSTERFVHLINKLSVISYSGCCGYFGWVNICLKIKVFKYWPMSFQCVTVYLIAHIILNTNSLWTNRFWGDFVHIKSFWMFTIQLLPFKLQLCSVQKSKKIPLKINKLNSIENKLHNFAHSIEIFSINPFCTNL